MKIKYLAHASFLLETSEGVKIITDPYEPGGFGGEVKYKPIKEVADIVLISHEHSDHNYTQTIQGSPTIVRTLGESNVKGIAFKGIPSYHDETSGSERGKNTIYTFLSDGIKFCFLGDLGHPITPELKASIGEIDILLIPVGGVFTIDSNGASNVVNSLEPKVVIPMHYKTPGIGFPLAPVDNFIRGKTNVKEVGVSAEVKLPEQQEIWVFTPELL